MPTWCEKKDSGKDHTCLSDKTKSESNENIAKTNKIYGFKGAFFRLVNGLRNTNEVW